MFEGDGDYALESEMKNILIGDKIERLNF